MWQITTNRKSTAGFYPASNGSNCSFLQTYSMAYHCLFEILIFQGSSKNFHPPVNSGLRNSWRNFLQFSVKEFSFPLFIPVPSWVLLVTKLASICSRRFIPRLNLCFGRLEGYLRNHLWQRSQVRCHGNWRWDVTTTPRLEEDSQSAS